MRTSKFRQFKKKIESYIGQFSTEADKNVSDDEWEMPVHRHSAAEVLVWILNKTGATLRKSQQVEAWVAVVRQCWNLMDIDRYTDRNHQLILGEIEYYVKKAQYKKNEQVEYLLARTERQKQQQFLTSTVSGGVRRIRRATGPIVRVTDKSGRTEYFTKYVPPPVPWIVEWA